MGARKILLLTIAALAGSALLASSVAAASLKPADYQQRSHWLYLPTQPFHKVDVFYLYPTEYTKPDPGAPIICPVNDPGMMAGAQAAFQRQATALRTFANIYAPYYRQAAEGRSAYREAGDPPGEVNDFGATCGKVR
ncbi:MAG: DUF3089 domain-containing protein [candidate division NC10 bacterium]